MCLCGCVYLCVNVLMSCKQYRNGFAVRKFFAHRGKMYVCRGGSLSHDTLAHARDGVFDLMILVLAWCMHVCVHDLCVHVCVCVYECVGVCMYVCA